MKSVLRITIVLILLCVSSAQAGGRHFEDIYRRYEECSVAQLLSSVVDASIERGSAIICARSIPSNDLPIALREVTNILVGDLKGKIPKPKIKPLSEREVRLRALQVLLELASQVDYETLGKACGY